MPEGVNHDRVTASFNNAGHVSIVIPIVKGTGDDVPQRAAHALAEPAVEVGGDWSPLADTTVLYRSAVYRRPVRAISLRHVEVSLANQP